MSRYRKVDPRIWNDEKFRELSDKGKLAFLFLLTHPHMTALGAMRATLAGLAEELGWESEAFREAFREALAKGMAEHDQKACFVAIPKFLKYNSPESPNVVKAWVGALDLLPECDLKTRTIARSKAYAEALPEGFAKALPEAFAKGMPYQEQEQEHKQEQEQKGNQGKDPERVAIASPGDAHLQGKKRKSGVTFATWLKQTKAAGEKAVSDYGPVWDHAKELGIPADWVEIAWIRFKERYTKDEKAKRKLYVDWRRVFLRAIDENWFKLWFYSQKDGCFQLTTVGVQADISTREAA